MTRHAAILTLLMISGVANVWFAVQLLGSPAINGSEHASSVQNHGSASPPAALVDRRGAELGSAADFHLQVEEEVMGDVTRLAGTYWASAAEFDLEYSQAMFAAQAEIRRRLLDAYGNQAAEDPLFRHVFRPMGPKYWFLSSDQQVGIQQLRFERDVRLHDAARARSDALSMQDGAVLDPAMVQAITRQYEQGLRNLLDDDTLFEFLLRESQVAQQLRASEVNLSEAEFRAAFSIMNELQCVPAGPQDVLQARTELRELLGNWRFAELWASRDPMYAQLLNVANRHDLRDSVVMAVYETMNDFQDQRMRIAGLSDSAPERIGEEFQRLTDDEHLQVAGLVGDEVADDILRSRAVMSFRLFGGAPPSR